MLIMNKKGNILADCASVYIAPIPDKAEIEKIFCYQLTGVTTTGKSITIGKYPTEAKAKEVLNTIALDSGDVVYVND